MHSESSESRNFVVQLEHPDPDVPRGRTSPLIGRVENLESGEWIRFRSARGLLHFIRQALAEPDSDSTRRSEKP